MLPVLSNTIIATVSGMFRGNTNHCTLYKADHTRRTLEGKVGGVPRIGIVTSNSDDPDPEH